MVPIRTFVQNGYNQDVVSFNNVAVRFGDSTALELNHFELKAGELVAVMGPNGAGKTTLLQLVAQLLQPTQGEMVDPPALVAYVRQHPEHHSWMPMTAREVVNAGRYHHTGLLRRFRSSDHDLVAAATARLDVQTMLDRPFRELSGGQRQRVLIASALATDAPCLLLDEPISGLDIPSQEIITSVAQEERSRGRLVIMTTHHFEEAQVCDRVILLSGEVIADGTPQAVLRAGPLADTFGHRLLQLDEDSNVGSVLVDDHGHVHG